MGEYIDREQFKQKYLCCGHLPEMSEEEFDKFPVSDVAQVVHGQWIDFNGLLFEPDKCSVCGGVASNTKNMKYCPHCSAKMDIE